MSRATIAHSLGDIIISPITNKVITISSSSIIWVLLMVQHLKGYCWLWTMLLPSGHYSGDLKKVSTMTPPFQASLPEMPFDRIVGSSASSLLCKRKTNPKKRHKMLSVDTWQHFSLLPALAGLTTWSKHWPRAKVCPLPRLPLTVPVCWLISLSPLRRWFEKKPLGTGRFLEAGHEQTLGRHTHAAAISVLLEPNLCQSAFQRDVIGQAAIKIYQITTWSIGFSEIGVVTWTVGVSWKWVKFNLATTMFVWNTGFFCKCLGRIMMMLMIMRVMMRVGSRSV